MPQAASCWSCFFHKTSRYPTSARRALQSNSLFHVYRTRCTQGLPSQQRRSSSILGNKRYSDVDEFGLEELEEAHATSERLRYGAADRNGKWASRRNTYRPQESLDPHTLRELARDGDAIPRTSLEQDPQKSRDNREEFAVALRQREVKVALGCLASGAYDVDFIRGIPTTSFSELIALLDVQTTVKEDADALAHFPAQRRKYMGIRPIASTVDRFLSVIEVIAGIRRNAGKKLGVVEYRHLLRCAAKAGNVSAVEHLWHHMNLDGVVPDTQCFNARMEARVWSGIQSPKAAAALRVTSWHMRERELRTGPEYQNYHPGPDGIETQVKEIFNTMLGKGCLGDEETFCQMIVAFGREGNIFAIKGLLLRIWGIQVDAILSGHQPAPRKELPRESPLCPTESLMFAIVHAFGSNNLVPNAFRILNYIHLTYSIPISSRIWQELFTWTSVLARRRSGVRAADLSEGQLPMSAPEALWHTIQSPPYNVAPTFLMHHFCIKALLLVQRMDAAKAVILSATNLYLDSIKRAEQSHTRLSTAEQQVSSGILPRKTVSALKTEAKTLTLAKQRNHMLLRHWCRWWLWKGNIASRRSASLHSDWASTQVPLFIAQLGRFLDNRIWYKTQDGSVVDLNQRTGVEGKVARLRREAIAEGVVVGRRIITVSVLRGIRGTEAVRWWPRGPGWSAERMLARLRVGRRPGVRKVAVGRQMQRGKEGSTKEEDATTEGTTMEGMER